MLIINKFKTNKEQKVTQKFYLWLKDFKNVKYNLQNELPTFRTSVK